MKNTNTVTIQDMLRGCRLGRLQSAGLMQVIPLLSALNDPYFKNPSETLVSTKGYGKLHFENRSDQPVLVPCHAGYVVKSSSQDHAMAHAGFVASKANGQFDTAMCIQETQPGLISASERQLLILPYALREAAFEGRSEVKYDKLWASIREFNRDFGVSQRGNLATFLKSFERELNGFIAEFEAVPEQVGAVIFIDGQVVGVERCPSQDYFESVWQALIRECYGSQALKVARQKAQRGESLGLKNSSLPEDLEDLEALKQALEDLQSQDAAWAREQIKELLNEPFTLEPEQSLGDYQLYTVNNRQFLGQVVQHPSGRMPYASLIVRREWLVSKAWQRAQSFSIDR